MEVPEAWEAVLLALAAWRTFQLLAGDDILDPSRRYVTDRLSEYWEDFLTCPYCAGFWIAVAWWVAWQIWSVEALIAATPFALSAGVIAAAKVLSSD